MKKCLLLLLVLITVDLSAQVDNTMYGLYQTMNPSGFQFASIDPWTGQVTNIGSAALSNMVNSTGAALDPYNQTFSYQDEDSWLSIDLLTGEVVNDVVATLPNVDGSFDNFRFNAADTTMYGIYRQVMYDPITGYIGADLRLATCDLTTGLVTLISPSSVAESYTMSGSTIDPYLMVYYFETEGKFMGLDLYNGEIYSQPTISVEGENSSFGNYAYSCADTTVYGLIMQNGLEALGKINPATGVVTALPTQLNYDNYVMNSGGAIDPVNLVYYFQTLDSVGIKMVGLSLVDGSVVSESSISSDGNYFIMYRIQSDCYKANPTRLNVLAGQSEINDLSVDIYPNPAQDILNINTGIRLSQVEIVDAFGRIIERHIPTESNFQISLQSLNSGMYYVRMMSDDSVYTRRIVKN